MRGYLRSNTGCSERTCRNEIGGYKRVKLDLEGKEFDTSPPTPLPDRGGEGSPNLAATTETERSLICEFVRLYANILAYFEKSCFFRQLWTPVVGTQSVGYGRVLFGFWANTLKIGLT